MASRFGAITIPIFATLDKAGFKQAQTAVGRFGKFAVRTLAAVSAAAVVASAKFAIDAVKAASDYEEALNNVNVVFGKQAKSIEEWGKTAASTFGQTSTQAISSAASFASLGKAAGLEGKELTGFSTTLVELASDLSSFKNLPIEEALAALGSGLRGESEPLRRFDVLLNDATLRAKALEMGLISTTKNALTPAQKTLATYQVILEQTKDAQGDFANTSDSLANSQKTLAAAWGEIQIQVGKALLPTIKKFAKWLKGEGLVAIQAFFDTLTGEDLDKVKPKFRDAQLAGQKFGKAVKRLAEEFVTLFEELEIDDPNGSFWSLIDAFTTLVNLAAKLLRIMKKITGLGVLGFQGWLQDNFGWLENLFPNGGDGGTGGGGGGGWGGNDYAPPKPRAGTLGMRGGTVINVNGTVLDPEGTARAIQRVLTQSQRRAGAY